MWETWVWSLGGKIPWRREKLLQYSGLENFMDYIVHGVAKSRTRLSNFFTFTIHIVFAKHVWYGQGSMIGLRREEARVRLGIGKEGKIYYVSCQWNRHKIVRRKENTNYCDTLNKCRIVTNESTENTATFMIPYFKSEIDFLKIFYSMGYTKAWEKVAIFWVCSGFSLHVSCLVIPNSLQPHGL